MQSDWSIHIKYIINIYNLYIYNIYIYIYIYIYNYIYIDIDKIYIYTASVMHFKSPLFTTDCVVTRCMCTHGTY